MLGERLIVAGIDGNPEDPMVAVETPGGELGVSVKTIAGEGFPYYVFDSIPFDYTNGIVVDFTGAPICDESVQTNIDNIEAMLANPPLDKISEP